MFKKIFIGVLVLTVGGAFILGLASASQAVSVNAQDVDATASASQGTRQNAGGGPIQQQQSTQNVGEPWVGIGTISGLDSTGMTLKLADASSVYVELGPSSYWQSQGITLAINDPVTVQGFFNGDQYHAASVTTANGDTLQVRSQSGQPLWAGSNGNGSQTGQTGSGQNSEQIPADQWVTVTGVVTAINTSSLTVQDSDKAAIIVQLGRQSFVQDQNVTFTVGDQVEVQGFWQNDQFQAGQITNVTTDQRLMLRDPNGRPLWGGPGRNGSENSGQGNGGQGSGNGNGGQGNGNGGGGKGNGNANRNAQSTPQATSQS